MDMFYANCKVPQNQNDCELIAITSLCIVSKLFLVEEIPVKKLLLHCGNKFTHKRFQ
jgi:hypothetical protein